MKNTTIAHGLTLLIGLVAVGLLTAGEKNGVSPTVVSLPSGPGSIEGLGESFEPMLQTGTAKYDFRIALPPGVAGNTPGMSLSYDGGFGNGPVGYRWKSGPGSVRRQCDRGVPRYRDSGVLEDEDTFLGTDGTELVELRNGAFLCRIEGSFTRYRRVWEKFVFAGSQRIARVKGTLDPTRARIQRMRIARGWNVLTLAVEQPLQTAHTVFGLGDPDDARREAPRAVFSKR